VRGFDSHFGVSYTSKFDTFAGIVVRPLIVIVSFTSVDGVG